MVARTVAVAALSFALGLSVAGQGKYEDDVKAMKAKSPFGSGAANEAMEAAVRSGEVDRAMNFYSEDAVMLTDHRPAARGKAEIRKFFQGFKASDGDVVNSKPIEERVSGDVAFGVYTQEFTFKGRPPIAAKAVLILVRENGLWKRKYEMANTDAPPAAKQP
jgi:ketosteroid isomerase-like protein